MTARITSTRSLLALMARIFTPTPPRSRRARRASFASCSASEIQRAQGMPGARCARSLACKIKKHTSKSPRSRRSHPAFPAQWFYGLYRALPGDRALLSPSSVEIASADLTPASRRQNHTTSPSAKSTPRLAHCRVHRIPFPTSVTIASAPLWEQDQIALFLRLANRQAKTSEIQKYSPGQGRDVRASRASPTRRRLRRA